MCYLCYSFVFFTQPVHISCVGEGPVVHIMPLDLDWGQLPVLEPVSKTVRLSNESLIPAKFTAHMASTCRTSLIILWEP